MSAPCQPNVILRPRPVLTWDQFGAGFLIGFIGTLIIAAIAGAL